MPPLSPNSSASALLQRLLHRSRCSESTTIAVAELGVRPAASSQACRPLAALLPPLLHRRSCPLLLLPTQPSSSQHGTASARAPAPTFIPTLPLWAASSSSRSACQPPAAAHPAVWLAPRLGLKGAAPLIGTTKERCWCWMSAQCSTKVPSHTIDRLLMPGAAPNAVARQREKLLLVAGGGTAGLWSMRVRQRTALIAGHLPLTQLQSLARRRAQPPSGRHHRPPVLPGAVCSGFNRPDCCHGWHRRRQQCPLYAWWRLTPVWWKMREVPSAELSV